MLPIGMLFSINVIENNFGYCNNNETVSLYDFSGL